MKQLYSILVILLSIGVIHAQEKWGSIEGSIAGPNPLVAELCGDTIVEGKTYEKLYVSYFNSTSLQGGRRLQGDSVFIIYFPSNTESLLYDFSMEVGDSISNSWGTIR